MSTELYVFGGLMALVIGSALLFHKFRRKAKRERVDAPLVRPSYRHYQPPSTRVAMPRTTSRVRKPDAAPAKFEPPTPIISDSGLVPIDFRSLSIEEDTRSKPFEGGGGAFGGSGASASYDAPSYESSSSSYDSSSSSDSGSSSSSSD